MHLYLIFLGVPHIFHSTIYYMLVFLQLLAILVSKTNAPKGFAKCLGWQEVITRLLTVERKYFNSVSSESGSNDSHERSRSNTNQSLSSPGQLIDPSSTSKGPGQSSDTPPWNPPACRASTPNNNESSEAMLTDLLGNTPTSMGNGNILKFRLLRFTTAIK